MKSDVFSLSKRMPVPISRKQRVEINKMYFWRGREWGSEVM
jgi:hypothetical protein